MAQDIAPELRDCANNYDTKYDVIAGLSFKCPAAETELIAYNMEQFYFNHRIACFLIFYRYFGKHFHNYFY